MYRQPLEPASTCTIRRKMSIGWSTDYARQRSSSVMQLDDLYRRVIMDHYKNPRNRGTMDEGSVTVNLNNPTCGDRIELQLQLEDGIVKQAKFTGEGCSISMSSA